MESLDSMEINNIRAILKPTGYKTQRVLFPKEKLFGYDYSPLIAYGIDRGTHIDYKEAKDQDDLNQKINEIKKIALDNISKIEVKHTVQILEGEKILFVDPHEYASEKILDKVFLGTVAKELGTESFLVGIPHQGVFAAVSSMSNFKGKFMGFMQQKFENPEANPITPHVFQIEKGKIVAVAGEDTGNNKNTISLMANGDLIVDTESTNLQEFKDQVSNGYSQAMLLAMKNKEFSGNIIFNEKNKDFRYDDVIIEKCNSFIEQILNNEMAQIVSKAMSGNGITPSFTHNGKPINLKTDTASDENKSDIVAKKKKWWQFGK